MLIYDFTRLEPGGLYLFFPAAAPSGGLWGIFERHDRRGGVLLGVIEQLSKTYISTLWADAIVFGVLVAVLVVKPTGLLGKRISEKV